MDWGHDGHAKCGFNRNSLLDQKMVLSDGLITGVGNFEVRRFACAFFCNPRPKTAEAKPRIFLIRTRKKLKVLQSNPIAKRKSVALSGEKLTSIENFLEFPRWFKRFHGTSKSSQCKARLGVGKLEIFKSFARKNQKFFKSPLINKFL